MRMDTPVTKEYEMPLHLQLAMRKAELEAQDMTWDQLIHALLSLYQQRLLEIQAIKDILQEENIVLEFDMPTNIELAQLTSSMECDDDEDEDDEELQPF